MYNKIKTIIEKNIEREQIDIDLFKAIVKATERFENKPINKHIANAVQKHLGPLYKVRLNKLAGLLQLYVWSDKISANDFRSFMLGYNSDPFLTRAELFRTNTCHTEAAELRNDIRRKNLDQITDLILQMNKFMSILVDTKEILKKFEDNYAIEKEYGIEEMKLRY